MQTKRTGFTLVELLVVIAIIGILMGLLIPAVNSAREVARRNQCSTQMKNLSLATIQYADAKGRLPGYVEKFGKYAGGADPTNPTASATPPEHVKVGTWTVSLLPWLDAQPTYEHWTEDRYPIAAGTGGIHEVAEHKYHILAAPNMAIMQCPSNPADNSRNGKNSYVANTGMAHRVSDHAASPTYTAVTTFLESQQRDNGAFNCKYNMSASFVAVNEGPDVRLEDFKDGVGMTMLFLRERSSSGLASRRSARH